MRWIYADEYNFGRGIPLLRQVHGFVLNKPARIRQALIDQGVAAAGDFEAPTAPDDSELRAVHSDEVIAGLGDAEAIARGVEMGLIARLPTRLARRFLVLPQLLACGGTRLALEHAARGQWVGNLSGGFHHARPDLSHGFCLVNDVAWAVHCLNDRGQHPRILILDLDLHQGDGNSAAFAGRDDVFTASLHQQDTFPMPKLTSDLDVGLAGGGVGDDEYHGALDDMLETIASRFVPDVVIYVAGTDPFEHDAIGAFDVSRDGLVERDRKVADYARRANAGLVVLPGGGYSASSPDIAAAGLAAMAE